MAAAAGQFRRRGERPLGGTVTPQTDPLGAGAGQTIIIIQTRNQLLTSSLGSSERSQLSEATRMTKLGDLTSIK